MTPTTKDEWRAYDLLGGNSDPNLIRLAVTAYQVEREACARLTETAFDGLVEKDDAAWFVIERLTDAIRQRGKQ